MFRPTLCFAERKSLNECKILWIGAEFVILYRFYCRKSNLLASQSCVFLRTKGTKNRRNRNLFTKVDLASRIAKRVVQQGRVSQFRTFQEWEFEKTNSLRPLYCNSWRLAAVYFVVISLFYPTILFYRPFPLSSAQPFFVLDSRQGQQCKNSASSCVSFCFVFKFSSQDLRHLLP